MQTKDAIRSAMDFSNMVFKGYLGDLEDADLLRRPGPGCNHLAWQCGHLITAEAGLLNGICPGKAPDLPDGFAEAHAKENAGNDDASAFCSKSEYLELMQTVRAATLSALDEISESALDEPAPEQVREFCPTAGHVFLLIATHPMMHAGQAVPVRRQLGKPVLF